jgi:hypothetical protein
MENIDLLKDLAYKNARLKRKMPFDVVMVSARTAWVFQPHRFMAHPGPRSG